MSHELMISRYWNSMACRSCLYALDTFSHNVAGATPLQPCLTVLCSQPPSIRKLPNCAHGFMWAGLRVQGPQGSGAIGVWPRGLTCEGKL